MLPVPTLTVDSLVFASMAGLDPTARRISMIALVPLASMAPLVTIESVVSFANALQVLRRINYEKPVSLLIKNKIHIY